MMPPGMVVPSSPAAMCLGFCPPANFQPSPSAYREPSFGHGTLDILNATHAYWQWHRNQVAFCKPFRHVWCRVCAVTVPACREASAWIADRNCSSSVPALPASTGTGSRLRLSCAIQRRCAVCIHLQAGTFGLIGMADPCLRPSQCCSSGRWQLQVCLRPLHNAVDLGKS